MEVNIYRSLRTDVDTQYKLLMRIASISLPLLQEENATVTSGKQGDGQTTRGQCGVNAQMVLMSQVKTYSLQ